MNEARENRDWNETPGERIFNFWVGVFVLMIGVFWAVLVVYWLLSVIFGSGSL